MRPLRCLTADDARKLTGLFFDVDDTVLSEGVLGRAAYAALWDWRDAGLGLVALTGRPAGWGEFLARQWPLDAVIAENGAIVIERTAQGSLRRIDGCSVEERARRSQTLAEVVDAVRLAVPDAQATQDRHLRISDVTWDIGEFQRLPELQVLALLAVIEGRGARSSRSSVHVHATLETADKASGAVRWLTTRGTDAGAALVEWGFVGDSPNDAACFSAFHATFGVANVARWLPHMTLPPRWCASLAMGDGFAEIVRRILELR